MDTLTDLHRYSVAVQSAEPSRSNSQTCAHIIEKLGATTGFAVGKTTVFLTGHCAEVLDKARLSHAAERSTLVHEATIVSQSPASEFSLPLMELTQSAVHTSPIVTSTATVFEPASKQPVVAGTQSDDTPEESTDGLPFDRFAHPRWNVYKLAFQRFGQAAQLRALGQLSEDEDTWSTLPLEILAQYAVQSAFQCSGARARDIFMINAALLKGSFCVASHSSYLRKVILSEAKTESARMAFGRFRMLFGDDGCYDLYLDILRH